jgi:hypothetical protein
MGTSKSKVLPVEHTKPVKIQTKKDKEFVKKEETVTDDVPKVDLKYLKGVVGF